VAHESRDSFDNDEKQVQRHSYYIYRRQTLDSMRVVVMVVTMMVMFVMVMFV
jgi:hypothetical protein